MKTRQLTGPMVLFISFLLGALIVIFRDILLPGHFSNDAVRIQSIAQGVQSSDNDDSYGFIGGLYRVLGLSNSPVLAGLTGYGILMATLVIAFKRTRMNLGWVGIILTASIPILGAVFLGTYSKDIVVSVICFLALAKVNNKIWDSVLIIAMSIYAINVRDYWIITASIFLVFRFILNIKIARRNFLLLVTLMVIVASYLIYVVVDVPGDYFRTMANSTRLGSEEAQTAILRFVEAPEPLGGIANNVLTMLALVIPLPIAGLSTYHTFLFIAISGMWMVFILSTTRIFAGKAISYSETPIVVVRGIALLLSFIAVQALFEPDYGSSLRHLVPVMPLMLIVLERASTMETLNAQTNTIN